MLNVLHFIFTDVLVSIEVLVIFFRGLFSLQPSQLSFVQINFIVFSEIEQPIRDVFQLFYWDLVNSIKNVA